MSNSRSVYAYSDLQNLISLLSMRPTLYRFIVTATNETYLGFYVVSNVSALF
jgi:hypothetical protein